MTDFAFIRFVDTMIGSRAPTKPPLLSEFREARIACEKENFRRQSEDASNVLNHPARQQGLRSYLAKEFPGCKSLKEAVDVRKLQIQIAKAEDPNYDPMNDPKWNPPNGAA